MLYDSTVLQPIMLITVKNSLTNIVISFRLEHMRQNFEGEITIITQPTTLFEMIIEFILNLEFILNSKMDSY